MRAASLQAAAAAFVAAAVAMHAIVSPDLWWHLASGRWILEHGAVPTTDVFTYTLSDRPWINLQWLTDVLMVGVWNVAGPDGLVLAKTLVLMTTAALLVFAGVANGAGASAAGLAAIIAVLAGAERTMVRPEILSGCALALIQLLLLRASAHRRSLWLVPFVVLVWTNLHALAFLGPLTVLWHALLHALEARLPNSLRDPRRAPACVRTLFMVALVSFAAQLVNPYGVQAWLFPAVLFERINGAAEIFGRILEFGRPGDAPGDPALRVFWLLVVASILTLVGQRRRFPLTRLLSLLPFLALALLARRNIPLFAIAAAPVLALGFSEVVRGASWRRGRAWLVPGISLVIGVLLLRGASGPALGVWRDRGLFVAPGLFPESCIASLEETSYTGPLFHDLDFGGYLAWRSPHRRTFIDGRLEVAGPDSFREFVDAHESATAWRRVMSRWGPEILLLQHASTGSAALLHVLLETREWTPVCYSPEAALLVARGVAGPAREKHRPPLDIWERILSEDRGPAPGAGTALRFLSEPVHRFLTPAPPQAAVRRANDYVSLCLTLDWTPQARAGTEAVLLVAPRNAEALLNLGWCDVKDGDVESARRRWTESRTLVRARDRDRFDAAFVELDQEGGPGRQGR